MSNLIRVTEVLSLFQNLWKIPEEILARKTAIGSEIHKDIHKDLFGETPLATPYLESFRAWKNHVDPFSIHSFEKRVDNEELGLSGCPDMVAENRGELIVYDFKTSAKEDPLCWPLQGVAYIELLRREGHKVSDLFHFVQLRKDGKRANSFVYKYTLRHWEVFQHAMACARFYFERFGSFPHY